jgi:cytochrome c-type biogenesis protein CcmH/NrfG/mono/diheme cytochrome c family protein
MLAFAFNAPAHAQQPPAAPVTYNRQIAPIFYKNCTTCHHDGGSGPFSLMNYGEARRWGPTVEIVTGSHYMPPWLPSGPHNQFVDDRRLSTEDIALIRRWVQDGMKEGNKRDAVAAPTYASDWQLGPPDLVLEMDTPVAVPADGTDIYRNAILPVQIPATRWIRAMEIKTGSPRVVHHANLLIDRTASLRRAHPDDWKAGIPGMDLMVDAGDSFDPDSHFLYWKPDSSALVEPADLPWRLDPGNDLVLNLHLKPTGKPETVRARIGLYFTPGPAKRFPILLQLEDDAALKIPPGNADFVVEDQLKLPEDVDVLAVYPHAHYLGKRLEGWAELPNRERRELILIENWDIDRQSIYRYTNPVFLPANSVLHMRYTYDNSAANPHNPNSPPIRVTAGNRSADEMGHLWLQLLPRATGGDADLRAPILRAWMEHRIQKDPQDPIANFNIASLDMTEGNYRQATDHYRASLKARPNDPRTMTALASVLSKSGDQQSSLSLLRQALTIDPEYAYARYDLAVNELQQGEYAAAEQDLRAVLAQQPQDATAHLNLGGVLLATGTSDAAQAEFETVLRIDANNFEALFNLSMIEIDAGQVDQALGNLRAAELLHPDDVDVHRALAEIYARQGDQPNALREQKQIGAPAKQNRAK